MQWAPYQVERIMHEAGILAVELPDYILYELPSKVLYIRGYWESNGGFAYGIQIELPAGYPDECPDTWIVSPSPLYDYWGRDMRTHKTSGEYHIWDGNGAQALKICTFRPAWWDASNTLVQLVHKSHLWILAFEEHR